MYLFLKKLKEQEEGMFTLEMSIIFPTIFMTTIALILVSLVIFNQVTVYQRAHMIAERIAFTWDNSSKDIENGHFEIDEYTTMNDDGLYWRTNAVGQSFINRILPGVVFGAQEDKRDRAQREVASMLSSADITVKAPKFDTLNPQVEVTVKSDFRIPEFISDLMSADKYTVTAYASVKDPVEVIRTTDMIVDYGKGILGLD